MRFIFPALVALVAVAIKGLSQTQSLFSDVVAPPLGQSGPITGRVSPLLQPRGGPLAVVVYVRTPAGAIYGPKPALPAGAHPVSPTDGTFIIPPDQWVSAHLDLASDIILCLIDMNKAMATGQPLPLALGAPEMPQIAGSIGPPVIADRAAGQQQQQQPAQGLRGVSPPSIPTAGQQQQQPQQQQFQAPSQQFATPPAGDSAAFPGHASGQSASVGDKSFDGAGATVGGKSVGGASSSFAEPVAVRNLWGMFPPPGSGKSSSSVGGMSVGGKSFEGGGGGVMKGKAVGGGQATITLTSVPPLGQSGDITGRMNGITPANQRVGCYVQMPGGALYGPKPSVLFAIQGDGSFTITNCIMNDSDRGADIIVVLGFSSGTSVPPVVGAPVFPPEVTTQAIAQTTYSRAAGRGTSQATSGGSQVSAADLAAQVPWPPANAGQRIDPAGGFINFAGFRWVVKDSGGQPVGPADNVFSARNIWVDGAGLHNVYAPTQPGTCNGWAASEVFLDHSLGYGVYLVRTVAPADASLDHLIVSSPFFLWADVPDGTPENGFREVDVESSKWGWSEDLTAAQFVLRPLQAGGFAPSWKVRFPMSQLRAASGSGSGSGGCNNQGPLEFNGAAVYRVTFVVKWFAGRLQWYAFDGLYTLSSLPATQQHLIASFTYPNPDWVPTAPSDSRVHVNLWHLGGNGRPPSNNLRVHSVTTGFEFTPQDIPLPFPAEKNIMQRSLLEEPVEVKATATATAQPRMLQQILGGAFGQPPQQVQFDQRQQLQFGRAQQFGQQQQQQLQQLQPLQQPPSLYQPPLYQQQVGVGGPTVGGMAAGAPAAVPAAGPAGGVPASEANTDASGKISSGDPSGDALKHTLDQMGVSSLDDIKASAEKALVDSLPDWALKAAHEAGGAFVGPDGKLHGGGSVAQGIHARSIDLAGGAAGDGGTTSKTGGISKQGLLALTIGGGLLAALVIGLVLLVVTFKWIRGGKKLKIIGGTGGKGWARLDEQDKEAESHRRIPASSLSSPRGNASQQQPSSSWYSILAARLGRGGAGQGSDKGSPLANTPSAGPAYSASVYSDRKATRHSRFAKYLDNPPASSSFLSSSSRSPTSGAIELKDASGAREGAAAPRLQQQPPPPRPSPLGIGESGRRAFQPQPSPTAASTLNPQHRATPTAASPTPPSQQQHEQQQRRFWTGPESERSSASATASIAAPAMPRRRSGSQMHV